jgi:hypothetical protein
MAFKCYRGERKSTTANNTLGHQPVGKSLGGALLEPFKKRIQSEIISDCFR